MSDALWALGVVGVLGGGAVAVVLVVRLVLTAIFRHGAPRLVTSGAGPTPVQVLRRVRQRDVGAGPLLPPASS